MVWSLFSRRRSPKQRRSRIAKSFVSRSPHRQPGQRVHSLEQLEARQMLAAAIWTNTIQPYNTSKDPSGLVSPLDVLLIINELNKRLDDRRLPLVVPEGTRYWPVDVNCDGLVTPLDALRVINHLNGAPQPRKWLFDEQGGSADTAGGYGAAGCRPVLIEGDSTIVQVETQLRLANDHSAVQVLFEAPQFDNSTSQALRDAFEVLVLDQHGAPLVLPHSTASPAAYNWSEELEPSFSPAAQTTTGGPGELSSVTINLVGLPAGTPIQVVARLLNNDRDNNTQVVIHDIKLMDATGPNPDATVPQQSLRTTTDRPPDERLLEDVSSSVIANFGRTSHDENTGLWLSDVRVHNNNLFAIRGELLVVIENLSSPDIQVLNPDGRLADGRPYLRVNSLTNDGWLAPDASTTTRPIRFRNPTDARFTFELRTLGNLKYSIGEFTSTPSLQIEAGREYSYRPTLSSVDASPLTFSLASAPTGMLIDSQTGTLTWQTSPADVGLHSVRLRAADAFGLHVEQVFTIETLESLANRPPVFVSEPETEAVAAGAFEVITLPTGSLPSGLAVGNFGVLNNGAADSSTSINQLSLVAINQGSQTISLMPGLARDGAGFNGAGFNGTGGEAYGPTQTLSVGEPPIADDLLRQVLDIDVGLPAFNNTAYDSNRVMGLAHGDFNGDGILDVATSIVYQFRPFTGPDAYERRIAITLGRGDGTFEAPIHFAVPGPVAFTWDNIGAIALQAKDFDLDGKLDLLVSETKGKKLLFYKGLGDGNFLAAREQSTGTDISGYKVADLNGDGILDLVAMRADSLAFGALLGNGDGSFQPYAEFSTHTGYTVNHNFAIGDLNGDGLVDFVSGNHPARLLNVYLGNGDGTFTRGVDLASRGTFSDNPAVLDWSMALVIGDFSGNGHADIAYTTYSNSGFGVGYGGGIALYEGDGSGATFTWSTAVNVAMSQTPQNIHGDAQPVDLNGDGHLDLVFTGRGEWGNYAPGVNVAINDGTGKFTSTFWIDSNLGTHPQPSNLNNGLGVLVGDFNNDGMLDLLTARSGRQFTPNQFSSVSLILADSPGTYRAAYDVRASSAMWGTVSFVEYADFNNDGILDIWGPANQNPSFTQLGNGDGTFQQPITATPWIGNEGLGKGFAADLDLDGNMDVVWAGWGGIQGGPQGRYLAALGNGDGTFRMTYAQTGNNTPSGYAPAVMKPADFDGDGYMDFVALTGLNTIEIMRNVPEVPGTFARSYSAPFGASILYPSLAVGDFDSDGVVDAIAVRYKPGNVHDLLFYHGNGDGTLAEPILFPFAPDTVDFRFPKHIAVGDLNSDGNLDFVINASYHRSAVVLGNGDGTFQPPMVYRTGTIFGDGGGLHLIDLNADGNLDLVSMDDTVSQRTIEVRFGQGDGTFGTAQLWGTSEGTGQLAFGDLDNDGRIDIGINGNSRQEAVATFLGNRQGLSGVLATDINGDGRTDILAINHDNSHVKRLISDGRGNFTRLHDLLVGAGPVDLLSGDFSGNGRTDFLTINRSGRSISVMLADGLGSYSRTDVPLGRLPVAGVLGNVTGGEHDDLLVIDAQLNALFVLTQDSSGGFAESAMIPLGDKPTAIAVGHIAGDRNGDGTADVIVSLAETNRLMILRSLGSGQFADPTYISLPNKPGKIAAADLNGDGLLDLAVTFPETGEVALLFGMGQSRFTQPQRIRVGSQPDSIAIVDTNGDGLLDILVTNAGDDTASVILNRFDPNQLYRYAALAIDPDDDPLTYSIVEGPGGMILDSESGAIRWAPSADQLGINRVVLHADDGRGGTTTQEFTIHVEPARTNSAPVITTLPTHSIAASETFTHTVSAIDPENDRLRYRLIDGPEGSTLDPVTGLLKWDPRGIALQFNSAPGAQGQVQFSHHDSHNADSLTIEGWFRFSATGGNQVLVNKALNWITPAFFTLRYFSGVLQFLMGDGTAAGVETLSIAQSVQPEQWVHLAATFDDSTGVMTLLVNGNQVASRETTKRIGAAGANIPLLIGSDVFPFSGDAYGLRLWSEPKSPAELISGMHQQFASSTPNLFVDLRFSEGDSLTVLDQSSVGNRGQLRGVVVPRRIAGLTPLQTAQFTVAVEDGKGGMDLQTLELTVKPQLRGSISGNLFQDDNGDDLKQDTEPQLANWTVFIDTNGNSYRDPGEAFSTTDASGRFQFNALLAGSYPIAVETPAGFSLVANQPVSVTSQLSSPLSIPARPAPQGQLRGSLTLADSSHPVAHHQVFADLNGNGIFDPAEPQTFTDRNGYYALTGLAAGNYSVRTSAPAGWLTTAPASAAHDVVLSSEELLEELDFVLAPRDSLSALKPMIVSRPPLMAEVQQAYRYAVAATSPDGRSLAYTLSLAPTGMVIDSRTGQIVWTPSGKQAGRHQVIVRAATDNSSVDLQSFVIEVAAANTAPLVVSRPASPAVVNRPWTYAVVAQDAEQTELIYELDSAPTGASIEANTGLLQWTPNTSHIGLQSFSVSIHDAVGAVTLHAFELQVVADAPTTLPFAIRAPRADTSLLSGYLSRVSGVDSAGQPLSAELLSGPSGLKLDASGFIEWQPTVAQLGMQTLQVRFRSASGDAEDHPFAIHVRQTVSNLAPRIESTPSSLFASSLFATAGQLYAYDLVVTDDDHDALSFELVTAPEGMSIHPQLGTLRWLPTLDQLGQSTVTLQVVDPQAGVATQTFTLTTLRVGGPPRIESIPATHAAVGSGYLYSLLAVDAENDPLTYSLIEAPGGMTIDTRTGEIAWTPTAGQLGQQAVFIAVADAAGNRATQSFAIQVAAGVPNRAPVISSVPNLFAAVGEAYRYALQAADPEGAIVTYSLRRGPAGMAIDAQSGQVTWTPTAGQAGREVVALVATDAQGGAAVQAFEVDILGVNSAPQIVSTPPAFAWAGGQFQYDIITRDADRDPIRYEFTSSIPTGMTLDPLGRIRWQTSVDDMGTHSLIVRVSDPRGGSAMQQVELAVRADNVPPKVSVLPRGGGWPWDGPIVVLVSAVDNVAVTDIELFVNDLRVPLDANRTARLAFEDWGPDVLNMVARARDAAGNEATASAVSFYRDPEVDYESGEGLPVAAITSPSDAGTVYGMVEILGTAVGGTVAATGFKEYRLSYAPLDQLQFTEFVHSTTPVADGLLGVWDTTLLENDAYVLRLEVVSEAGNASVHETTVGLSGNLKLGNFRLSFEDLTIPVAGIPITIVRTYDTLRSDRDGDFGYGWRLEYRNTDLRVSLPKSGLEDIGIYTPFKEGTRIFLTLPGGSREGFTFTPDYRVLPGFGQQSNLVLAFPRFTSDRGVSSRLSAGSGALVVNEFGELFASGGIPWNPASPDFGGYTLTTADGLQYQIDGDAGVMTSVKDPNGNVITFSDSGISFAGESIISIARNQAGRISSVQDRSGTRLEYRYQLGRLSSFIDGENYSTSYRYDANGRLSEVIDPLNRPHAKTTYDAAGRLASVTNRDGKVIKFTHSPANQQQILEDANGAITVLEFDSQGNILRNTNPLGEVTESEFDASGNEILTRDPLGREIRRAFDDAGRILFGVDASGATSRFSYDARGNLLSYTAPTGLTTQYEYDPRGNLLKKIEPDGTLSIRRTVDERGSVIEEIDALGHRTTQEFDSQGRPIATTDPLGSRIELQRRVDGIPTERIDALGNRAQFSVDRRGLITSITGADGKTVEREFNPIGENISAANGHGSPIQHHVNADGQETLFSDALGNTRERIYDRVGNLITEVDARGQLTRHEHDALGRRTKTIYPDGSFIEMAYDAVGNLVERSDELGFKTRFAYDANNRLWKTVDALGRETVQKYDLDGRLVAVVDTAGRTTAYSYNSRNDLIETRFPDGTRKTSSYDAAQRLIEEIAADGTRTRMEYDPAGRLTAMISSDGSRMSYVYDRNNRLIAQVDALGRETNFTYNVYGQLTRRSYPDGSAETTVYDEYGFIDRIVRTDGQIVEQDYDPNGKLIRQRLPDGTEESFLYSPTGKLLSAVGVSGTTSFQYDARDRLIGVTQPSGVRVMYGYDAVGNRSSLTVDRQGHLTTTTYTYDAIGRLTSTTASTGEANRYLYDPAGNVSQIQYANGITESRVYDALNRPIAIVSSQSGASVERLEYTYSPAGLRESVARADGSRVDYGYNSRHRLTSEIHRNHADEITWQENHEYDAVGNRVAIIRNGQRFVQTFNSLDQLLTSSQDSYSYDNRGRLVQRCGLGGTKQFVYDSEDQLLKVFSQGNETTYTYDAMGNRIGTAVNGAQTEHVLDLKSPTGVSQVLEDRTIADSESVHYVFGMGREMKRSEERTYTYHYDANGHVRQLANSLGDSVIQYVTSAFGTLVSTTGDSTNSFRFTGERTDEAMGLVHLRARYYLIDAGQFLTRDPYSGTTDDPTSLHRYLYAHQNPVTNRDPTGESTLAEQAMVGGLVNGLISVGTSYLGGNRSGSRLFFDFIVGAGFGALGGGLGGTVAKALTNDFMRTAVFANAASSSLVVKYSPRLVYAIPNTFLGVVEDVTKGFGTGDIHKPGWTLNVVSTATINFVFNVVVGPANIDAYTIKRTVQAGAGVWIDDIGGNLYKILTKTEREKLGVLREIVVQFGEGTFSKAEEYFFQFMSESAKFIAGAAIAHSNKNN